MSDESDSSRAAVPSSAGTSTDAAVPPSALRVLAHPLRNRLVRLLRDGGPATASALARAVQTTSGTTSYHLRLLADAGLVVEADGADGRSRLWRAGPPPRHDAALDAVDEDSLDWLERDYLAYLVDKASGWLDGVRNWPPRWRRAAGQRDYLVQVTDAQLVAMHEEIAQVCEKYRRVGAGNPAAKRVSVYTWAIPLDAPPRR